tara:strand:- start:156 stop:539 length:384 start_codon:yes stop_codon:yes gene_type:complete
MAILKNRRIFLRWFKYEEFNSPDDPLSYKKMEEELLKRLDFARELANTPFKITSGYRTKEHNRKIGGVSNSSHLKGLAADIYCDSNINRWRIIDSLIKARFTRIGIGKNFIHCDIDEDKANGVIWLY